MTERALTATQLRALRIFQEHGPLMPREFAIWMWPDAQAWNRSTKAGPYGATTGGGMNLAGGGYIGKLRKLGWVEMRPLSHGAEYALSAEGRCVLARSPVSQPVLWRDEGVGG